MENKVFCFGYSRKSPDDKESTEVSLRNQGELISNICKKNSWILLKTISDKNISGSDRKRKGINQVLKEVREYKKPSNEVYIILKDSKRFARDGAWAIDRLRDLAAYGIRVFSILDNKFLDPSDLGDRIIANVNEQAIWEGKRNAQLTQELKISKRLPCIPAPFGYKYGKSKNWVIVPKKAKIVQQIVSNWLDNVSCKSIAENIKIPELKCRRIIQKVKEGLYSGFITFERKIKDSEGNVIKTEMTKYEGTYSLIISKELFEKVNAIK